MAAQAQQLRARHPHGLRRHQQRAAACRRDRLPAHSCRANPKPLPAPDAPRSARSRAVSKARRRKAPAPARTRPRLRPEIRRRKPRALRRRRRRPSSGRTRPPRPPRRVPASGAGSPTPGREIAVKARQAQADAHLDPLSLGSFAGRPPRRPRTRRARSSARFSGPGWRRRLKGDLSPVTMADRSAEQAMRAVLSGRFPDHGILGEEFGLHRPECRLRWVLDPIDGTRAFITGRPTFGTLIALLDGDMPVLGLIDQPVTGERWVGAPDAGRGFGVRSAAWPDAALARRSPMPNCPAPHPRCSGRIGRHGTGWPEACGGPPGAATATPMACSRSGRST